MGLSRVRTLGAVAVAGAGLLAGSWWLARDKTALPGWEESLTVAINGWPDSLRWPLWPVMQSGNVWMAAVLPLAIGSRHRRWSAVAAAALGPLLAWGSAKVVKEVSGRGRPADLIAGIDVREAGVHGFGFVSGHAAVAFASAVVVSAYLPARWRVLPLGVAAATAVSRVYFGAHLPLDVVGGAGLGLVCGAAALLLLGEPRASASRSQPSGTPG